MICPKCGEESSGNFCSNCGTPLVENSTEKVDDIESVESVKPLNKKRVKFFIIFCLILGISIIFYNMIFSTISRRNSVTPVEYNITSSELSISSSSLNTSSETSSNIIDDGYVKVDDELKNNLVKDLNLKYDEFEGISWYQDTNTTKYIDVNSFHLYFGIFDDRRIVLRLVIQYTNDDWLFIKGFNVKTDTKTYSIPVGYLDIESDNSGGKVWEWYDKPATDENIDMIKDIISCKKSKLRYKGNNDVFDRELSNIEINALSNILDIYEKLIGKTDNTTL